MTLCLSPESLGLHVGLFAVQSLVNMPNFREHGGTGARAYLWQPHPIPSSEQSRHFQFWAGARIGPALRNGGFPSRFLFKNIPAERESSRQLHLALRAALLHRPRGCARGDHHRGRFARKSLMLCGGYVTVCNLGFPYLVKVATAFCRWFRALVLGLNAQSAWQGDLQPRKVAT